MRPIGIDLFAGAGGLSLGFEQAGFDVVAAVEYDPIHAAVHAYNFPECSVLARSVTEVTGESIRRSADIDGDVSVVFGGAPCQGFSLIGKRNLDDPRNALVRDFVRLVKELDSDYFVFENVKGLTVGEHRRFLDELIETFSGVGYQVRQPWMVLNAYSYGVPQDRKRLFLLGAKKGLPLPHYPKPTTRKAGSDLDLVLPAGPNCLDALGDLPDAEGFQTLLSREEVRTSLWGQPSAYARLMRALDDSAWWYGHQRAWDPELLTASGRTEHSEVSRLRFMETAQGEVEPISRFFKLAEDGVCNTLRAGTDSARGAFTSPRPIHYKYPRCITVREMARLHGFPDWFRFHRTKWHGARQIGNSVPPPLARAVASQIMLACGQQPQRSERILESGDPALLDMDMSRASSFFGVAAPIQKRNSRSGVRKRSQAETESWRISQLPVGA